MFQSNLSCYIFKLYLQTIYSKYGAWKDLQFLPTNTDQGQSFVDWFNSTNCNDDYNCEGDIYVFATVGYWAESTFFTPWIPANSWTDEAKTLLQDFLDLPDDIFDTQQTVARFASVRQNGNANTFVGRFGENGGNAAINNTVTVNLGGQVTGFDMIIGFDLFLSAASIVNKITYSSSSVTDQPIIKLADDVSSWNIGDTVVIGSTDFNQDHTEEFRLVNCTTCQANEVKLNRSPSYRHWGRVDTRTGVDQRAPVMLSTRNVKIEGEVGWSCQYAKTRESQEEDSPNFGRNFCNFFDGSGGQSTKPNSRDMHGGHVIITGGFDNVHITHVELKNMGQPQLARYPLHWHFCDDIGDTIYEDPSFFAHNSIHHGFNRFITIHGTENARVYDNAGYLTRGHGYFIEDGWETGNEFDHNLGMVIHQGITLPTDKGYSLCQDAREGFNGSFY